MFAISNKSHDQQVAFNSDVIIVGGGLAGIFVALKLAPRPVTLISPTPLGKGASSAWAQGGIAAAIGEGDHPDKHVADTLRAGGGLVDEDVARLVAYEAPERIYDLLSYGVPFDKDLHGRLKQSREAAHSANRVVRVKGDMAGKAIMSALIAQLHKTPSIHVLENYKVHDLVVRDNKIQGLLFSQTNSANASQLHRATAKTVILVTGGIGGLYHVTTNPSTSRGEGLGIVARAGAIITDAEFVQFHPTAIDVSQDPAPLATEALRGEGAVLVNKLGTSFMQDYHPDGDLAPRDSVAKAVHLEHMAGRGAFLDCRDAIGARFAVEFPAVYSKCVKAGINPVTDLIPVAPAAHYHMGGVQTDGYGRTSVEGLWACGEVASTGMHGANRLASNSLLEAVVFATRIAEDINNQTLPSLQIASSIQNLGQEEHVDPASLMTLRQTMSDHVGVMRSQQGLEQALDVIDRLECNKNTNSSFSNICFAARFVITAALARTESRGAHNRTDYPNLNPNKGTSVSFRFDHGAIKHVAGETDRCLDDYLHQQVRSA